MSKEAYYFSHDSNARHDDKILELRSEYGWEGYGLFWAIVETLRDCSNYTYPSNAKAGLALSLNIDKTKLEQFINHAIYLGLFCEKDGVIYSESLMKRMEEIDEKRRKRAEAGRLGGKAKAMTKQKPSNAKAKPSKEKKEKESKEDDILFDVFWDSYGKKVGRIKSEAIWDKMGNEVRTQALEYIPTYHKGKSDKQFYKDPERYLTARPWEDSKPTNVKRKIIGYVPTLCQDSYRDGREVILSKRPIYEGDEIPFLMVRLKEGEKYDPAV